MPRRIEEIAADFDVLGASHFDCASTSADGWDQLERLCDEMRLVNDVTCGH